MGRGPGGGGGGIQDKDLSISMGGWRSVNFLLLCTFLGGERKSFGTVYKVTVIVILLIIYVVALLRVIAHRITTEKNHKLTYGNFSINGN